MQEATLRAAVDLGSNSFRLEIGRLDQGHLRRVQYLREPVRLGGGLDADGNLDVATMQRGWDCLARFAERLRGFRRDQVRAVATQTLREARNRDTFIERGSAILGFPIDVVSGAEEARLIYQGVAHLLPQSDERRLVVDVGGRSTELILGCRLDCTERNSYLMGSVSWSARYFPRGEFTPQAFEAARAAALAELDGVSQIYGASMWDAAYGASGTIGAVGAIVAATGGEDGCITVAGLNWMQEQLLRARQVDRLRMTGLKEDRKPVIGGGLSIVRAIFDLLSLDRMFVAQGALRHGVLYDLLGRERPETDQRGASVRVLMQRFVTDREQADRVAQLACTLFTAATPTGRERAARKLAWAGELHEVGCCIARVGYHHHGAYILEHIDAAGFALPELHHLSLLVLGQRGKLRKVQAALDDSEFALQLMCLRTAVALCHARRTPDVDGLTLRIDGRRCIVHTRSGWAAAYPQSAYLLREEMRAWQKTPWKYVAELE